VDGPGDEQDDWDNNKDLLPRLSFPVVAGRYPRQRISEDDVLLPGRDVELRDDPLGNKGGKRIERVKLNERREVVAYEPLPYRKKEPDEVKDEDEGGGIRKSDSFHGFLTGRKGREYIHVGMDITEFDLVEATVSGGRLRTPSDCGRTRQHSCSRG